jgi:hypothetical protein
MKIENNASGREVASSNSPANVKEHAPPLAGASIETGGEA